MKIQLEIQSNIHLNALAFAYQEYSVRDIVAIFHEASHKKKSVKDTTWLKNLEVQIDRLKSHQLSQEKLCSTLQSQWSKFLTTIIQAISQFEKSYKASCPCAELAPSPYIKTLKHIEQQASMAMIYIGI